MDLNVHVGHFRARCIYARLHPRSLTIVSVPQGPESVSVLASEDDFLAINKPPGIPFHAAEGKQGILQLLRELEDSGALERRDRLFPVHRLDQVTSGVLVFARGRANANRLSNEFRHGRTEKVYLALSDRRPTRKQGRVIGDMVRGRRGGWILERSHTKPAITDFVTLALPDRRPGLRLFVLRPRTGRTHQIRVAMKSLSAPILGDPLYGRYDLAREEDRTYLHAWALRFHLNDRPITLVCPPGPGREFESPEFRRAVRELGGPFAAVAKQ